MKKKTVLIVIILVSFLLSGCCLKHDMKPATCTEPATCTKCGKTDGLPLGHTEVTDAVVEPTCTETGLTEGKHCSVCGEVLLPQEIISATGHTEVTDAAVEPTCTETGLTEGKHCSVCGEVLLAQDVVDVLEHKWQRGEPAYIINCALCGETRLSTEEPIISDDLTTQISFFDDGTYLFEYPAYHIQDYGTYIYSNDILTMINANGLKMASENGKIQYISGVSELIIAYFTI